MLRKTTRHPSRRCGGTMVLTFKRRCSKSIIVGKRLQHQPELSRWPRCHLRCCLTAVDVLLGDHRTRRAWFSCRRLRHGAHACIGDAQGDRASVDIPAPGKRRSTSSAVFDQTGVQEVFKTRVDPAGGHSTESGRCALGHLGPF